MVFNKKWFSKHQKILLFLSNNILGRKIFCIDGDKSSVGKNKIVKIEPNAVTWQTGENEYSTEYRTHDKYAKRLYYTFKPLWFLFHAFDLGIANNLDERLNLGFDTLTVYPDASPETTSVDGRAFRDGVDESFSSIRSGVGNGADDSLDPQNDALLLASTTSNQWSTLIRSFFLYDTSSLTSLASITNATQDLYITSKSDAFSLSVGLVQSSPASNTAIASSDYEGTVSNNTRQATDLTIASMTTSAYNTWTLNATGLSNISKTSITKFGMKTSSDIDNSAPTWSSGADSRIVVSTADHTGTSQDPKLTITYTISGTRVMIF